MIDIDIDIDQPRVKNVTFLLSSANIFNTSSSTLPEQSVWSFA